MTVEASAGPRSETGASAVEYGLLVAAIAAIIVVIVFALGRMTQGSLRHDVQQPQERDEHQRDLQPEQR